MVAGTLNSPKNEELSANTKQQSFESFVSSKTRSIKNQEGKKLSSCRNN
jgi:hypothetical protein